MIRAFGARAERYAHTLGDVDAIVTEPSELVPAYLEAVRRRGTGEPFYGMVLADDPRVTFGYRFGQQILSGFDDYDVRRSVAQQLCAGSLQLNDGARADRLWTPNANETHLAIEFLGLCDAMLVRSWNEFGAQCAWFDASPVKRPYRPVERILGASAVPAVPDAMRRAPEVPTVLVWAPQREAYELELHLLGLHEFLGRVVCVTAGGAPAQRARAEFLHAGDPALAGILAVAGAVLCPEPNDPADAVAFARLGYGVVAPITSGAHEFAGTIVPWDALNAVFLATAIRVALARPAAMVGEPSAPPIAPRVPQRPAFIDAADLPLVSVITPTYNRREDLRRMLGCLAAQTYPNIESVIVNDGGVAIDDIVDDFPFARLIDLPENVGGIAAQDVAYRNCRGAYIAQLPDDDWFNPDHIERLVTAMMRSGCAVAHGTGLLRFIRRNDDGSFSSYAFNGTSFSQTIGPTDSLITANIGNHQMIAQASVFADIGWYRTDLDIADNELITRIATKYPVAFVDHTTSEFRSHAGAQGQTVDIAASLERFYDELYPVPDRPVLAQHRKATLESVRARPAGRFAFQPTFELVQPPPA
jgi:hypothetical protein